MLKGEPGRREARFNGVVHFFFGKGGKRFREPGVCPGVVAGVGGVYILHCQKVVSENTPKTTILDEIKNWSGEVPRIFHFCKMTFEKLTLNCNGKLLMLDRPVVMGILNVTPDSFFDGGKHTAESGILNQAEKMLSEGAALIDVGGMSSRPGADIISEEEEAGRVLPVVEMLVRHFPEIIISVDTIRSGIARQAVEAGAAIVNDISAGRFDEKMYETVAALQVPYILMHMQGAPKDMQSAPAYEDVVQEVLDFFIFEIGKLRRLGVKDLVVDPGFGFGKTVEHNYDLLRKMHVFRMLELPILAGISRKSMICKVLGVNPDRALNGTTALHMVALQQGAKILRVHDVREAVEVVRLWEAMGENER